MVLEVLTPVRTRRRARRQWVFVVVLLVIGVAAAAIRAHITAARRGYSDTRGATVVHYTLASRLLGRSLSEIGVVPAGGGRRPLLVLLHGRHDPSPVSWLIPSKTGPESLLSNQFFRALASLGARAPVVVLVNGGGHSYYHDRKDGPWASMILREAIPDAVRRFRTVTGRIAIGPARRVRPLAGVDRRGDGRSVPQRGCRLRRGPASTFGAGDVPRLARWAHRVVLERAHVGISPLLRLRARGLPRLSSRATGGGAARTLRAQPPLVAWSARRGGAARSTSRSSSTRRARRTRRHRRGRASAAGS